MMDALSHQDLLSLILVTVAGLYAGTQNVLAGGGSFITLPTLMLVGLNPLSANITSTVGLFPNQVTSSLRVENLREMCVISLYRVYFL